MEHPQMISPWQSYCNTKGGVFIGPFCTSYCLILPWLRCRRDHFRLQKCRKIRDFNVDFWKKISGSIAPRPPYWGGATAPLPRPNPPRRLHASTFGPSIVRAWTFFRNISPWWCLQSPIQVHVVGHNPGVAWRRVNNKISEFLES